MIRLPAMVLLSSALLLSGCSGVRFYEPIVANTETMTSTDAAEPQVAEKPETRELLEEPSLPRVPAKAAELFAQANQAMAGEDWQRADTVLYQLMNEYPQFSGPYLNAALSQLAQDNPTEAEVLFLAALEVNHRNLDAYNQYAIFLRKQGRFLESEEVYLEALDVDESFPDTHRNIAVLYDLYLGDATGALQHLLPYQQLLGAEDQKLGLWIRELEQRQLLLVMGD